MPMFFIPGPAARLVQAALLLVTMLMGCATATPTPSTEELARQVADTERAFARTMADRNHAAFAAFIADEAIFFSGPKPLRGRVEVVEGWKRFYQRPEAPFSWEPAEIEVLASGTLAISSGPVRNGQGRQIATFTSIWRNEAPGVWKVVFDKGNDFCDCAKTP